MLSREQHFSRLQKIKGGFKKHCEKARRKEGEEERRREREKKMGEMKEREEGKASERKGSLKKQYRIHDTRCA